MNDIIKTKSGSGKGSCIIAKDVIATINVRLVEE